MLIILIVTTFTDVIAFFVGSNTLLPGLESFCIYAAVAIFAIYALQVGVYPAAVLRADKCHLSFSD
jgi:Niemann-Pick C1 protein